jgi:hypothetical protein
VRYTAEQFQKKLKRWAKKTPKIVKDALGKAGLVVQKDVQSRRLSGQVLREQTGTLKRSINFRTKVLPGSVRLQIGTNVHYGKYWEEGFVRAGKPVKARPFLKPAIRSKKKEVMELIADGMLREYKRA